MLSRRHVVVGLMLSGAVPKAAAAPRLALRGYDPVAYFTLGTPTRGLPELEYQWDEARYRFSTPEHRDMFKADPVRYAPQFAGVCVIALTRGDVDEANPEYWLVNDGKLYLFGKPIGPELFKKDQADTLAKAAQNQHLIADR